MTEKMQSLTEQGMERALAYIETTESFVVEQAPLLVQEVLRYEAAYAGFWACFWSLCVIGTLYFGRKMYVLLEKEGNDPFPGFLLGFFGTMGCLACTFFNLATVVKITIAPRLYLLERLNSLL